MLLHRPLVAWREFRAASTRSIQPLCTLAACLMSPPIDSALTDGVDRACSSVRP